MQAKEIMTHNPACCPADEKLTEVARMMVDHDCGAIPVVEGNDRRPSGIISDRDIVARVVAAERNPAEVTAREVMSTPCVTVRLDADLDEICDSMERNQVRRLLVVDDSGACVGIVSQADVALSGREKKVGEIVKEVSRPTTSASSTTA